MSDPHQPFTEAEVAAADAIPLTHEILLYATRLGTQALAEFGTVVLSPLINTVISPSKKDDAIITTFYRLLAAVRTLSDLRQPYHFQAISGQTRLVVELCADIELLVHDKVPDGVEKWGAFTTSSRFSAAVKIVKFYNLHPTWEVPGDIEEHRRAVSTPGKQAEFEATNKRLWKTREAPPHWSGHRWKDLMSLVGRQIEEHYAQWASMHAWHVHGGGAGTVGLAPRSYISLEILNRDVARDLVPEAYRLVAVSLHLLPALPSFFEELDRVANRVRVLAVIEAKLATRRSPAQT